MKTVKAKGWCGLWSDGTLGWRVSPYLSDGYPATLRDSSRSLPEVGPNEYYRVEITVRLVRDKKGRPIKRRGGKIQP